MLSKSALILLGVAMAGAPLVAFADAVPDAAVKALAANYALSCTAALDPTDANLKSLFDELSPDFVNIDLKGKEMKIDEYVAQAKQTLKQVHLTSCDNTIESETSSDANTVVVVITNKAAGQIQAPDGNHDLEATQKSQDTWKNVNGTWLQTQGKDLRSLVKIDGKVVQDEGQ